MPMPEFVTVVVEATGRKQRVPAHYMDNPVLSRGLRLAPSAAVAEDDATPARPARRPGFRAATPASGSADTTTSPDGTEPPAETPATGEEE